MNEHAAMISRLDADLERVHTELSRLPKRYNDMGDFIGIAPHAKRRAAALIAERRSLEESANAAYRMPA